MPAIELGNRCSIRLSYGDVLYFQYVSVLTASANDGGLRDGYGILLRRQGTSRVSRRQQCRQCDRLDGLACCCSLFVLMRVIKPLYAARLEDLGPGDLVRVECGCGHTELLTAAMLRTAGLPEYEVIVRLPRRMRCREYDERGKAVVSIKWGNEPT
jgi:hypothetical protein